MSTTVTENSDRNRYEITADGKLAGFTEYEIHGDVIAFQHTEIDPGFTGRGLGGSLIREALDDARRRDLHVQPFCSFVQGYIAKHPEYVDLVPHDQRDRFGL